MSTGVISPNINAESYKGLGGGGHGGTTPFREIQSLTSTDNTGGGGGGNSNGVN